MFKNAVPSCLIHSSFLKLVEAPELTKSLTFTIEAGGVLRCSAEYLTDLHHEVAKKEWEVRLPRTSSFYKLLTGDL